MNRMICSWLTSGRSISRSTAKASSTMTAAATMNARPDRSAALDQPDEGQRREQHHRALGEVEHARGLVDQHEAERDERIHDPAQQPADDHLEHEFGVVPHVGERA